MKQTLKLIALTLGIASHLPAHAQVSWTRVAGRSVQSSHLASPAPVFYTSPASVASTLSATSQSAPAIIDLPLPDGSTRSFRVLPSSLLPAALAAKYPRIRTYTATAVGEPSITANLDLTPHGFHAMIYNGEHTSFVDPAADAQDGFYSAHYKHDELRLPGEGHGCQEIPNAAIAARTTATSARLLSGYTLRRYRLAISCTHQYAQKVTGMASPTREDVLSKMTTTMNRVNGIYERELSVTMQFVANEDTLIFTTASGDPLGGYNENASGLMSENQDVTDARIGSANYDIGHAFSTGAGGLSQVGVVCKAGLKAQSVTGSENPSGDGFDVDYVAHEIGHEYGSDHTFNNNQSYACSGNAVPTNAFEPGSGSTIMAYAGICTPDNVQANSNDYFHASSLRQMATYVSNAGDVCASRSPTGNLPPGVGAIASSYAIPARTPFELIAPIAHDSTGGAALTYCWEQWNLGDFGLTQANASAFGPLFRSFEPSASPVRTFPSKTLLLNGVTSNASVDKASGEKLPVVTRSMTFKLTVRSLKGQHGCFAITNDTVHVAVASTGSTGFTVTSQNATGISYQGYSNQQITWNVAGSDLAPVSTADVDIYMSPDGGETWPYHLGKFANNGSANVAIPNPDSNINAARFKVKGTGNIFFNVNTKDFKVVRNFESSIKVTPIPASTVLHLVSDNTMPIKAAIFDIAGRRIWEGEIATGATDIPVQYWPAGIYIMKLADSGNGRSIRRLVVE